MKFTQDKFMMEKDAIIFLLSGFYDRLIVMDGLAKLTMTGWRLGWSVWPESLIDKVTRMAINNIHVSAANQVAALATLGTSWFSRWYDGKIW